MSKAKDIARAIAGNPHINSPRQVMCRRYICANCHQSGEFVKVGDYYFHPSCPKQMIPFTDEEKAKW